MEFEKQVRQQLSRQAAAHSDHLKEVLQVQVRNSLSLSVSTVLELEPTHHTQCSL